MSFIFDVCQRLYDLPMSDALRESDWAFPIVETIHVLAITVMVGTIAIVDLRLLGFILGGEPVKTVSNRLLPITWVGFAILVVSGLVLFCSESVKLYYNPAFRIKVLLIPLAGLNVLLFHSTIYRKVDDWTLTHTPTGARVAAIFSLLLWSGVIICGRMIAYFHSGPPT